MIICIINVEETPKKGMFYAQMTVHCAVSEQFFPKKFA